MRQFSLVILLICNALGLSAMVQAGNGSEWEEFPPSPLNQKRVADSLKGDYSFWVGGHLYGAHGNDRSQFPAASFLSFLPELNRDTSLFFVSLGDVLRDPDDKNHLKGFQKSMSALTLPAYHVIGNHDLLFAKELTRDNRPLESFRIENDLFLFINTEDVLGGKGQPILSKMRSIQEQLGGVSSLRQIFVFSHRLLWAFCEEGYEEVDIRSNEPLQERYNKEELCELSRIIRELGTEHSLTWFSGDVGTPWSYPLFYQKDEESGIRYVATGISDGPGDALVRVTVTDEGLAFLPVALGSESYENIETYGLEFWKNLPKTEEAGKLASVISDKRFWAGMLGGLICGLLLTFFMGRKKRFRDQA